MGTGNNAMLLRGRAAGAPNFVFVTTSSTGEPMLLQQLSVANLEVDISGSTHSVSLVDTNRDGRADLVLRTNGSIGTVFANFAEYAITQTYNGSSYLHLIVFRKSDNRWRIEEF